jgi:hypothetical protein
VRWRLALLGVALGLAALAPAARAGTYEVYSCDFGGGFYGNGAWEVDGPLATSPTTALDAECARPGDVLSAALRPSTTVPAGWAGLTFRPPTGTTIADFTVRVHHRYVDGIDDTANNSGGLFRFGDGFFSGVGTVAASAELGAEGHWWGQGAPFETTVTLSRADSPRARSLTGTVMILSADCTAAPPCTMGPGDVQTEEIIGSRLTIDDPVMPSITAINRNQGLFSPGLRSGDEPVAIAASDNTGIRRAELVDVTDAANPVVVGGEDYGSGAKTEQGRGCDYTQPRPCPDISDEYIAPAEPLAGRRTVLVRVTDAAGNTAVSTPFAIRARGRLNGINGGYESRLVMGFPARTYRIVDGERRLVHVLRSRRTTAYGRGARLRGRLRAPEGQPVIGAQLRVLVRARRLGARFVDRGRVTTGTDGRFSLSVPKGSSRDIRVTYRAYAGDDRLTARATAALNVRARISARASSRVRPLGVALFRGRLAGRPLPPHGVTLELQALQPGRVWRTLKTTRTRRDGRFSTRYRLQSASGRFTFRMRLRPSDSYPYAQGTSRKMLVQVG